MYLLFIYYFQVAVIVRSLVNFSAKNRHLSGWNSLLHANLAVYLHNSDNIWTTSAVVPLLDGPIFLHFILDFFIETV